MTKYKELREAAEAAEKDAPSPWRLAHDLERGWNLIEFDGWSKDLTLGAVWAGNGRDVAPCARHIAIANPQKVLEILDALRAAEKKRDELREDEKGWAQSCADFAISMKASFDSAEAENATLRSQLAEAREALNFGVELIQGDAFGSEWKRGCAEFIRRAADIGGKGDG